MAYIERRDRPTGRSSEVRVNKVEAVSIGIGRRISTAILCRRVCDFRWQTVQCFARRVRLRQDSQAGSVALCEYSRDNCSALSSSQISVAPILPNRVWSAQICFASGWSSYGRRWCAQWLNGKEYMLRHRTVDDPIRHVHLFGMQVSVIIDLHGARDRSPLRSIGPSATDR